MGSLVGTRLGHFRIERLLGSGGMGAVYAATDEKLERDVAIKVMLDELDSPSTRKRFLREARLAAKVVHPNIATVFEVGEAPPNLYIVMELLEGQSLRRWLGRGRLPVEDAMMIGRDIARALARAHGAGIFHRDIKPENVFITQPSPGAFLAKVLDFGLAKQKVSLPKLGGNQEHTATNTGSGEISGTPGYWSPEAASGLPVDLRTDIFSFGLVLYEMLTGRRAFAGDNAVALVVAAARSEPDPVRKFVPNLSPDIEALLATCLAKKPVDRFADGMVLCAEIERVMRTSQRSSSLRGDGPPAAGPGASSRRDVMAPLEAPDDDVTTTDAAGPPVHLDDPTTTMAAPPAQAVQRPDPASNVSAPTPAPAITDTRAFASAMRDQRRLALAIAGGIAAAIVIVVIAFALASPKPDGSPVAASASAPPSETTTLPMAAAAAATASAVPAASDAPETPSFEARPGTGTPTPVVVSPGARPAETGSARPKTVAPGKKGDCAQPFVIDAQGVKHPKLHCL